STAAWRGCRRFAEFLPCNVWALGRSRAGRAETIVSAEAVINDVLDVVVGPLGWIELPNGSEPSGDALEPVRFARETWCLGVLTKFESETPTSGPGAGAIDSNIHTF